MTGLHLMNADRIRLSAEKVMVRGVLSAVAVAGVLALLTVTYFWRSPAYEDRA